MMKFIQPIAGAALIGILMGCAAPVRSGAARYLPEGDICYSYTNYNSFFHKLSAILDTTHTDFMQSDLSAKEKQQWSVIFAAIRLAALNTGLTESLSSGISSSRLPGDADLCQTSRVLASASDDGLLWKFSGTGSLDLQSALGQLPADTLAAVMLTVDAETLFRQFEKMVEILSGNAFSLDKQNISAQSFSGTWQLVCLPGKDGIYAELTLPDRDGAGRRILKQHLPQMPDGTSYLPENEKIPELKVDFPDNCIRISLGKKQSAESRKLQTLPEIRTRAQHLPADGIGIIFLSADTGKYIRPERPAHLRPAPTVLGVLSRRPGALVLQTISDWDPVSEARLIPAVLTPIPGFMKVFLYLDEIRNAAKSLQKNKECSDQLQSIRKALTGYAASHQGNFPAASGLEGFRELLNAHLLAPDALLCPAATGDTAAENAEKFTADNCSYVYVGGSTVRTPADFPLVIDWPLNHKGEFHVLTVSGKILTFQYRKLESCRHAVSFLQSRFLFPEADFQRLLKVAIDLDKEFLKGQDK